MDDPEAMRRLIKLIARYLANGPMPTIIERHLGRVARLLNVHDKNGLWEMYSSWPSRLLMVGIDPATFEIVDEVRWAHAIDYMRATETFRESDFRRWLDTHPEPSNVPAVAVPLAPHPKGKKRREEKARDDAASMYLSNKVRQKIGFFGE